MEENSEGAISRKRSLNGDGALALESDEMAVKTTKEHLKTKRQRLMIKGGGMGGKTAAKVAGRGGTQQAGGNPDFIGVILNSKGTAERVYLEETE